jgi:surfactin synthase thioesterase subunit
VTVSRDNHAQALCNELFLELEGAMSDAWISDDAGTDDPKIFLGHVYGSLLALEEARAILKRFLRKHRKLR